MAGHRVLEGPDLRKYVDTHGPLPVVLVAWLGATLAEALATVHKQGLLHRDLKPRERSSVKQ